MTIMIQAEAKILAVVAERRHIHLEQLLGCLPELTWNQVFAIVDTLSRRGLVCLSRRGFEYELHASFPSIRKPVATHDHALIGNN
jgi:hypothetical protein